MAVTPFPGTLGWLQRFLLLSFGSGQRIDRIQRRAARPYLVAVVDDSGSMWASHPARLGGAEPHLIASYWASEAGRIRAQLLAQLDAETSYARVVRNTMQKVVHLRIELNAVEVAQKSWRRTHRESLERVLVQAELAAARVDVTVAELVAHRVEMAKIDRQHVIGRLRAFLRGYWLDERKINIRPHRFETPHDAERWKPSHLRAAPDPIRPPVELCAA